MFSEILHWVIQGLCTPMNQLVGVTPKALLEGTELKLAFMYGLLI